jgi:glutamine synthetase
MSGPGNDHRLGANEAPPAIVSAYLGDDILTAVEKFLKNDTSSSTEPLQSDLGVGVLPELSRHATDRNRTSTFAFTGNKFEFRAVGAPHSASRSNMTLNTILADSIRFMADEIAAQLKSGKSKEQATVNVARDVLSKHKRVIFNGNGYTAEWRAEAIKRGLPNLPNTPAALAVLNSAKNQKLFSDMKVLSNKELEARTSVYYEEYVKKLIVEAKLLAQMAVQLVLPPAIEYQGKVASSISSASAHTKTDAQKRLLSNVSANIEAVLTGVQGLNSNVEKVHEQKDLKGEAEFIRDNILPIMKETRQACDTLETLLPAAEWQLPTYHEMLFHSPH